MIELCAEQEKDVKRKERYVISLDEEIGKSIHIIKNIRKFLVKMGDRFWSQYWEPSDIYVMAKQYSPTSEIKDCSLDDIEKALHFGVALDLCATQIRANTYPGPAAVYRIL